LVPPRYSPAPESDHRDGECKQDEDSEAERPHPRFDDPPLRTQQKSQGNQRATLPQSGNYAIGMNRRARIPDKPAANGAKERLTATKRAASTVALPQRSK